MGITGSGWGRLLGVLEKFEAMQGRRVKICFVIVPETYQTIDGRVPVHFLQIIQCRGVHMLRIMEQIAATLVEFSNISYMRTIEM
jgi:hypothetical protein